MQMLFQESMGKLISWSLYILLNSFELTSCDNRYLKLQVHEQLKITIFVPWNSNMQYYISNCRHNLMNTCAVSHLLLVVSFARLFKNNFYWTI